MSYGDYKENRSSFVHPKERFSDDKLISNSSHVSPQVIVFPYVGPPGSGPGLMGNRPGCGATNYLSALEHHASSLKSALQVVAALKNSYEDSSSTESDTADEKESEHKKTDFQNEEFSSKEHGSYVCNSSSTDNGHQINDLSDTSSIINLSSLSLSEQLCNASSPCNSTELEVKQCTKCKCTCRDSMILLDDKAQTENFQQADQVDIEGSKIYKVASREKCVKNCASQHVVVCSSYSARDNQSTTDAVFKSDVQNDVEDSINMLKKKALLTARQALCEFQRLLKEKEMSSQHKVIEGVLVCLTSICKEEELWRIHDDLLVSLEIPL